MLLVRHVCRAAAVSWLLLPHSRHHCIAVLRRVQLPGEQEAWRPAAGVPVLRF